MLRQHQFSLLETNKKHLEIDGSTIWGMLRFIQPPNSHKSKQCCPAWCFQHEGYASHERSRCGHRGQLHGFRHGFLVFGCFLCSMTKISSRSQGVENVNPNEIHANAYSGMRYFGDSFNSASWDSSPSSTIFPF